MDYIPYYLELERVKKESEKEGEKRGENRLEDLTKATTDKEYREKLLLEYFPEEV